ncbi:transcription-repair coupling factor [Ligilactobacillus ceti]|uniref:Transcription-repair-coupling factor n=1 Tax=Ligilactobacillus ceti DSM 22408 TaxID=1122146 RepID=A0A0R2KP65_9LACO|nr:transcription-repair coupling factor [Ligilactobacillus ceti]KRN89253.1 transcription-repair coupling factor [Ligilactobacillus ceti DSM 22408]
MELDKILLDIPDFQKWSSTLNEPGRNLITGLQSSAATLVLATLYQEQQRTMLIVKDDLYHAQRCAEDLQNLVAKEDVLVFPVEEMLAVELATSSPEYRKERIQVLNSLVQHENKIIVTSVAGVQQLLPTVENWTQSQLAFQVGAEYDFENLIQQLSEMGYERQNKVDAPGDFAVRGSILDLYPLELSDPIRLDFFDTELDSMRSFSVVDQRSLENIEEVKVGPATDFIAPKEQLKSAGATIAQLLQTELLELNDAELHNVLQQNLQVVIDNLQKGTLIPQAGAYKEQIYPAKTTIKDYVPADSLIVFDDWMRILEFERELNENEEHWLQEQQTSGKILQSVSQKRDLRKLEKRMKQPEIFMSLLKKSSGQLTYRQHLNLKTRSVQQFFGQMPLLKTEADRWRKQAQTVVVCIPDHERVQKMAQTLRDFEIDVLLTTKGTLEPGRLQIISESLAAGFEIPETKLVVLTEKELFNKATKKTIKRQTMSNTQRLKDYKDLKKGDYVVHVNHGIGQFMGISTIESRGKKQDYLTIVYRDDAKLFIPVAQLDRIQKYVSSESKLPHINKLGTGEWEKTKRRVANKIEDIADELIELYAKRDAEKGYAFTRDDSYQAEFEDAFPYSETADQLRSIQEIKRDMEKERPMDRLLIGDVGYGKTEVALRAAFKAIQDGKQVAFLAPTTVLAQQHYETMRERFMDFPVEIGILSRFNTPKETKEVIEKLKNKQIDIVVGTHRLLSKDVVFADLGLLIIDEEQRFGVKHKERLKQLKTSVDVLTLTATPIPRTLNMSMLGVRDLSVIETPPLNRYPIQTYVIEQNYGVIIDGIRREMARGGQVFYLHNRVNDIERVVAELQMLIPEARISFIHGQMTEVQLERVLVDFIAGEYDVLVTTTIIETGVDIPNVNTLFVEDADRMGLSQLYQLRGRVGRSNRVAYAYFMYQPDKVLTEVSEKRLSAIRDFTELGSGFKIAMRDLSIRGAGNLLGKQQHGFIDSVGYDLYTQMLKEAVAKKRGDHVQVKANAEISLDLEAYLPNEYIDDPRQKIEIYKRISQFENIEQYQEMQSDLIDRFGDYPKEVAALLEIGLLKFYADLAYVEKIKQQQRQILVTFEARLLQKVNVAQVLEALSATKLKASIDVKNDQVEVKFIMQPRDQELTIVAELQAFLKALAEIINDGISDEK